MAFKDILVHLDNGEANADRVAGAIALAKRHDGRVKGLALALESTISAYLGLEIPNALKKTQHELVMKSADKAVNAFKIAADAAGVDYDHEIVTCSATKAPAVMAFHARHADIAFLGQPNPDDESASFKESLFEGVLFGSGRPVYLVPYIGREERKIRKAVIAWDGGKKAARAVNEAIPLLQGRSEAVVLVINPEDRGDAHGEKPGHDIAAHLERHGIKTRVEIQTVHKIPASTILLNYLADEGADLLVMGAYGHSRLREKAFGGVTNSILHQMTTPVLMSE